MVGMTLTHGERHIVRVEFTPFGKQLSMTGKEAGQARVFCSQTVSVSGSYPSTQRISLAIWSWSLGLENILRGQVLSMP